MHKSKVSLTLCKDEKGLVGVRKFFTLSSTVVPIKINK